MRMIWIPACFFPLKPSALIMSEQCAHIECTAAQAAEKQEVKPGKSLRYQLYQQQVSRKVPGYKRAVKPRLALDCSWKVTRPWQHHEAAFLLYGFYSVHEGTPQLTLVFRHKTEAWTTSFTQAVFFCVVTQKPHQNCKTCLCSCAWMIIICLRVLFNLKIWPRGVSQFAPVPVADSVQRVFVAIVISLWLD